MVMLIVRVLFLCCFAIAFVNFFRLFRAHIGLTLCQYHAMFRRTSDAPPVSIFSFPWDVMWTENLNDEGLKIRDEYFRHMGDWWQAWRRATGAFLLLLSVLFIFHAIGILPDAKFAPSRRRDRSRDSILFPIANEIEDMRNAR